MNGKIIFFGTSDICIPFLRELNRKFKVELIITQPDKKGGRKNKIIIPPVKHFATENNIEYIQPSSLNSEVENMLKKISPDIAVVISYGQLIPKDIFQIPLFNTINVHFSLLPEYRGAAPVQRAIENGDSETGVSIFEISKKMDAGRLWAREKFPIDPEDTTIDLWDKLSIFSTPLLIRTIHDILNKKIIKKRQDHSHSTYAPPITKQEGEINWSMNASSIINKLRAFNPWPGIFFKMNDKNFKIKKAEISSLTCKEKTGEIIKLDKTGLFVSCANSSVLQITEFQPEGKKPMTPYSYSAGNIVVLP